MTFKYAFLCLKVSGLFFILLLFQQAHSQENSYDPNDPIDIFLEKNAKNLGTPVNVLVYRNGSKEYLKETNTDFSIKIPADAGEISQWFAITTIMMLVDENKLSLDDPISKYLPDMKKFLKGYVTIKDCITHTTGIEKGNENFKLGKSNFSSLDDEVMVYITKRNISEKPGTAFVYSRIGINLAAKAAEIATKKSFDRLAAEKLFRPCGMKNTTYYAEKGGVNPFSGAKTTSQDCMNFMQMLLNKGIFNNKRVLSENVIKQLLMTPSTDAAIKFIPEYAKYSHLALFNWVEEKDEEGNATLISQGSNGTMAGIDFNKKLAWIIMMLQPEGDKKRTMAVQIRNILTE
ncbi:MAG: serine hydrolase domain-containing protein [Chitinophagaceae bacterium]